MPQDAPGPIPKQDERSATPLIRCRRCDNSFVCTDAELSGAVDCPVCNTTASLSRNDITLVEQAARVQMRDGTYAKRVTEQRTNGRSAQVRAMALLPETRKACERLAVRLRRDALDVCPFCLYDISGVLRGDDPIPCPECGEETSRAINALVWGQRANESSGNRKVVFYSGAIVGAAYLVSLVVGEVYDSFQEISGLVRVLSVIAVFGLPIGVPLSTYRWLSVRNPVMNEGLRWIGAVLGGIANLLIAMILIIIANALKPIL